MSRICEWCKGPIRPSCRRDAKTCSKKCRQAKHRFRLGVAPTSSLSVAGRSSDARFAYADPPYPGLAKRYYGPEAQEVNHRILIGTLEKEFPDGWALSSSASALADVLQLCPPGARVCAWVRGSRRSVAHRARTAWEPLIVVGGRPRSMPVQEVLDDVLIWGGRQHSHPGALIGMKSAAFCEWMFRMLGAEAGDSMTDIFPGSGAVTRAWELYTSRGDDAETRLPGRFEEAQNHLAEQFDASQVDERRIAAVPDEPALPQLDVYIAPGGTIELSRPSRLPDDAIDHIRALIRSEFSKQKATKNNLAAASTRASEMLRLMHFHGELDWHRFPAEWIWQPSPEYYSTGEEQ